MLRQSITAIIGLVATAPNADASAFPLDTPVLLSGDLLAAIEKAGTGGTLASALQAIDLSLAPLPNGKLASGGTDAMA